MPYPGPVPFSYERIEWATDCAHAAYKDRGFWVDEAYIVVELKRRQQVEFLAWVLFEAYGPITAHVLESVGADDVFHLTVDHLLATAAVLCDPEDEVVDLGDLVYLEAP